MRKTRLLARSSFAFRADDRMLAQFGLGELGSPPPARGEGVACAPQIEFSAKIVIHAHVTTEAGKQNDAEPTLRIRAIDR